MVDSGPSAHYERLARRYDQNWSHSREFLDWMVDEIVNSLALTVTDRIVDVGCGTGLFTQRIADVVRPTEPILCVEPSAAMVAQLPSNPGLRGVCASAEDLAAARPGTSVAGAEVGVLDAILIKEAIHHVAETDRPRVISGLSRRLSDRGRFLVVMLPTHIDYPLFGAALRLFEQLQPDPTVIATLMEAAGLTAEISYHNFTLEISKDRYLGMVRDRYMSLLSSFDDDELEVGIHEIEADHPEDVLRFPDRFAFVRGVRR